MVVPYSYLQLSVVACRQNMFVMWLFLIQKIIGACSFVQSEKDTNGTKMIYDLQGSDILTNPWPYHNISFLNSHRQGHAMNVSQQSVVE